MLRTALYGACALFVAAGAEYVSPFPPTPNAVVFDGMQLKVDGEPFYIKVNAFILSSENLLLHPTDHPPCFLLVFAGPLLFAGSYW